MTLSPEQVSNLEQIGQPWGHGRAGAARLLLGATIAGYEASVGLDDQSGGLRFLDAVRKASGRVGRRAGRSRERVGMLRSLADLLDAAQKMVSNVEQHETAEGLTVPALQVVSFPSRRNV